MREAKRVEEEIDGSESSGGGGKSSGAPNCTDPAAVSADSKTACSGAEKTAAKTIVEKALKSYLKNFVEAEDGKYSEEGSGFKKLYNAEKKKKFLKDKPLGDGGRKTAR